jgi:branched-chain amino acid transport system substrate-binding protein
MGLLDLYAGLVMNTPLEIIPTTNSEQRRDSMKHAKKISAIVMGAFFTIAIGHASSIKIGFNVPLTGFAAADGKSALNGAELAVEQANAAGGINGDSIVLVVYDDQASPKEAVPIAQKLIEKDEVVAAISGSYSGSTRAAAGIFQESGVPYIAAYAVHPDITRAGNYVFRTSFVGEVQGRAGAKLIGETLGAKRVAVITLKNDFGKSLAAGLKQSASDYGITIVSEYEYGIKDRQFGPIVSKVKSDKPDAIYASGYFFTAGPLVSQLRAAGITVPIIGQEGYDSQKFIDIAGAAAEFESKSGNKADMVAASAHTAVKVIVAAMRKAGATDKAALRNAIADTSVVAATGTISFNALGEVLKNVQVQIVKDGSWREHSVISDSKLLAPPNQ